jgi:hypothetical protein
MQSVRSTIQPEAAAEALKAAGEAGRRAAAAMDYYRIGRRLVVWGVVWLVVNVAGAVRAPVDGTIAWPAVMLAGLLACLVLDIRAASGARGWRHAAETLALNLALAVFIVSLQFVIPQPTLIQVETLLTLVLGLVYIVIGLSIGWRLMAFGLALMAAVIAGSVWAPEQFFVWMAAAGGGGLILGGLWLRKA